jgi:hypothetical protein
MLTNLPSSREIERDLLSAPHWRQSPRSRDVGSLNVRCHLDRRKSARQEASGVSSGPRSSEISRSKHLEFGGRAAWIPARDRRIHRVVPLRAKGGLASAREFLCRGLGSRWFTERFHRNALVTHFQHGQVFCTARRLENYAVARFRLHQRAPQR